MAHKHDKNTWPNGSERPLTAEGEEKFRRAARGILQLVSEVGVVLNNPFARTWRGARARLPAAQGLGALTHYAGLDSVAIVGHRPSLHELVSYLLTADTIGEDCGARI